MELTNESQQKNATRLLPCNSLPYKNSVILDSPSAFLLQQRRFRWIEFDGNGIEQFQNLCPGRPIMWIRDDFDKEKSVYDHVVEHSASPSSNKGDTSASGTPPTQNGTPSSTKKRRTSLNSSLELRKAAHRRNFNRSSLHMSRLASMSPLQLISEEENDTDEENSGGGQSKSSINLMVFSPEQGGEQDSTTNLMIFSPDQDKSPMSASAPSLSPSNASQTNLNNNNTEEEEEEQVKTTPVKTGRRSSVQPSSPANISASRRSTRGSISQVTKKECLGLG